MFFTKSVQWKDIKYTDLVIDVREPHEYHVYNHKGSKNIPLSQISKYKTDKKVFVTCQSGMRSRIAVGILKKNGVDAVNIKGGMMKYYTR
ncbi:rhodanese-like domain-containing protein [Acholeplasma granularum]|uniref:rhodanese-like domain-containing protein n=1 Tax=Acholeplasma granularum TaxID=264635 RepID=UPI0004B9C517|nr:rhodanese-like domain-containing protein [Acholeplasma granularum]